jgi:dihydroflavonol-4-reductase
MEKVIVTGANGFVGSNLCRELSVNGYHVKALYRRGSSTKTLEGLDVDLVEGDIGDPESLFNAVKGCDGVFHIAALFRQAKNPDKVYWDVNVEGVKNVFDAAIKAGVKKNYSLQYSWCS